MKESVYLRFSFSVTISDFLELFRVSQIFLIFSVTISDFLELFGLSQIFLNYSVYLRFS